MTFLQNTSRFSIYILLSFISLSVYGQRTDEPAPIHENIQQRTNSIYDSLVKVRRDFHVYPELAEQENRTSKKIAEYLTALGLEVHTNIGGYGVVGILNGDKKGKRIAWRADIDALASDFPDEVAFHSKNEGVRHICGHDVHTTIALGMANVLASQKENLAGTVYFIFQPSEENLRGAKAMLNDGLLDIIDPEEIYALHISPMPSGLVATKADYLYADYKQLNITYSTHTHSDSLIEFTKSAVSALQRVADSRFWDNKNLLDPAIGLANPNTIFKNYLTVGKNFKISKTDSEVTISTNVSSSNAHALDSIIPTLKKKISASPYAEKLVEVAYSGNHPLILNNLELATKTLNSLAEVYGSQRIIPLYGTIPDGRSDDFAYFQNRIPGVYFLLGGSNFEKGVISMPHSPGFNVDETCIKTGVNFFSSLITERLND